MQTGQDTRNWNSRADRFRQTSQPGKSSWIRTAERLGQEIRERAERPLIFRLNLLPEGAGFVRRQTEQVIIALDEFGDRRPSVREEARVVCRIKNRERTNVMDEKQRARRRKLLFLTALFSLALCRQATAKPVPEADMEKINGAVQKVKAQVKPAQSRRILVFSKSIGFVHSSIPHGRQALKLMGEKTGAYTATLDDDPSVFGDLAELSRYDAVVFNNPCGNAVPDPQQRKNLLEFVRKGGGFAGIHCAAHVTDWPEYVDMVGCFSISHPWSSKPSYLLVEEPEHPLVRSFGEGSFSHLDEIYVFRNFSREKSRVLLSLDKTKTNMNVPHSPGKDADYPLSWVHRYGKGRVFYCGLGHYPAVFWNESVLSHYLAGIQYVLGDVEAEDTPREGAKQ